MFKKFDAINGYHRFSLRTVIPNMVDGTSWYRGAGPLSMLQRQVPGLECSLVTDHNWATLSFADALFMQRPFNEQHVMLARMCDINRVPLWIDYDDDLTCVPESNPTHAVYSKQETLKNIATIVGYADKVSVSTSAIKKKLDPIRERNGKDLCVVIPNAMDDRVARVREKVDPNKRKLILWRGSATHDKDMWLYTDKIQKLVKEYPEWTWMFLGGAFWMTMEKIKAPNVVQAKAVDPAEYFYQFLKECQGAVQIVPLHDNEFNRGKSNISWMEAAFSGSVAIAPNWEEWGMPGAINYDSTEGFYDAIKAILNGSIDPSSMAEKSWNYIQKNLMLSDVNEMRCNILRNLIQK
jgi:hypothetical protein